MSVTCRYDERVPQAEKAKPAGRTLHMGTESSKPQIPTANLTILTVRDYPSCKSGPRKSLIVKVVRHAEGERSEYPLPCRLSKGHAQATRKVDDRWQVQKMST